MYIPLLRNHSRYLILYGGAGSGKSVFASQKILTRIVTEDKHRILICRKVGNTIRQSIFKRMLNEISSAGLLHEFDVHKTDMYFRHLPTGNEIITTGLDDAEKLKSIEGVTSIWVEEATECTEDELDQLDLRMRGMMPNYKQMIITFNPISETHWLKHKFFDREIENATILKTTYEDNYFIDEQYKEMMEFKAATNPNFYRIYKLGEWGKPEVRNAFAYNFNYDKHVTKTKIIDVEKRFSQDFNVEPMANVMCQIWRDAAGHHIHFHRELALNNKGTPELIEAIKSQYTQFDLSRCLWTGDATARRRTVEQTIKGTEHLHSWKLIDNAFNLGRRLQVPRANPPVKSSRELLNFVLAVHPDIKFDESMKLTINEMLYTEVDADGNIMKKDRQKEEQRADFLDCVRYAISTWLPDFIDNPNKYIK